MREYTIIYERGKDGGWRAYAPDLPGLGVAADTLEEVKELTREGIVIHINALKEDGQRVPEPTSYAGTVKVLPSYTPEDDPLLNAIGTGKHIWQDKHGDEFIAELREGWESS